MTIAQTTPMRPAESNTRPAHALPPGSWDAHFHVFEPGYPHVDRPQYTFPEATLEQYLAVTGFLGISLLEQYCYCSLHLGTTKAHEDVLAAFVYGGITG